jgi:hypothetical protein
MKATEFYEKMRQRKNRSRLFLLFNSKLSDFDKNLKLNLNLNRKWLSPTRRKPICF